MSDCALTESNQWLRCDDVARILDISRGAAYSYAKTGKLPGVIVIGKSVRVSRRALERWLETRIQGGDKPATSE